MEFFSKQYIVLYTILEVKVLIKRNIENILIKVSATTVGVKINNPKQSTKA